MKAFVFLHPCMHYGAVTYPQKFVGANGIAYHHLTVAIAFVTLVGFWNLDFFYFIIPQFCISDMQTHKSPCVDYGVLGSIIPTLSDCTNIYHHPITCQRL